MHIHMYTKYVENNVFAPKVSKETSYYLCYIPKMLNKVFGIQFENALRHHFWCDVVCKCTCVCEDWGAHQSWRTRNAHLWFCENWDSSYTFAFSMDWNIYAQKNKQTTYCILQELPKWVSNMENIAGLQLNYDSQAKHTTISWMLWRKWNKWKSSINEVSTRVLHFHHDAHLFKYYSCCEVLMKISKLDDFALQNFRLDGSRYTSIEVKRTYELYIITVIIL